MALVNQLTIIPCLLVLVSSAVGQMYFGPAPSSLEAAPRQIFIPPPPPPCRGNYVRVEGSCKPIFRMRVTPNIVFSDQEQDPDTVTNDVPVDYESKDGGGANSLSEVDRELTDLPTSSGIRVPKRRDPTPSFVNVPRSTGGGGSGTVCGPGMVPDRSGTCRRRFGR